VRERQAAHQRRAARRQADADAPAIDAVPPAPDEAGPLAALHDPDGALVAHLQTLCQICDARTRVAERPDEQEELVLAG
jgi:hypothetical protein